ncbi:hypothetical protein, partial [Salmonella enterica]|uniref:hypothetical protein n=1 Tax=Salmonella enterica TaxID=28901 RepID=UPI003D2BE01E
DAAPSLPSSFEKCTISDTPAGATVVLTATGADGTFVYMGMPSGAATSRRYRLTSSSPCVLDRDVGFGESGLVPGLFGSVDAQG